MKTLQEAERKELREINRQLTDIYKRLYDMNVDTRNALVETVRADSIVYRLVARLMQEED
jgi:hypothetical protein